MMGGSFPLLSCLLTLSLAGACDSSRTSLPDGGVPDQLTCAAAGAPCGASGCCQAAGETCLPAGSAAAVCQHADLPPTTGPACNGVASSDLTGVSIEFPDDRCSFTAAEAAAGISIKYTVVVANTLASVSPLPLDVGHCDEPDPEVGLIPFPKLSGQSQLYCLCDVGGCADTSHRPAIVVPAGRHDRSLTWMGQNWRGPSDTIQPMGPAFPPGTYTFNVTAKGTWIAAADATTPAPFTVSADRTITISP